MKRKTAFGVFIFAVSFAVFSVAAAPLWSAGENQNRWGKISFKTPIAFSKPEKIGLDAVALIAPPGAGLGKGKIELTLATFSKEMKTGSGFKDDELGGYFRTTFLGAAPKGDKTVQRTFMGRSYTGDIQQSTIPKKIIIESYVINLKGGNSLGIAVSGDAGLPSGEIEKVIAMIAGTLREE